VGRLRSLPLRLRLERLRRLWRLRLWRLLLVHWTLPRLLTVRSQSLTNTIILAGSCLTRPVLFPAQCTRPSANDEVSGHSYRQPRAHGLEGRSRNTRILPCNGDPHRWC